MKIIKSTLLFLFAICISSIAYSQKEIDYSQIKLVNQNDYRNNNVIVMQAIETLLSTPADSNIAYRKKATEFLIRWMTGTPDFNYDIGNEILYFDDNTDLLAIYMACMAKYTLTHRGESKDSSNVKLNSMKLLLEYVTKTSNHIPIGNKLKELIDADNSGNLSQKL